MGRLKEIKDLVQETIDKGSTTIQQTHQELAKIPFDLLEGFEALKGPTEVVRKVHDAVVSNSYEALRLVNRVAGEVAGRLIERVEPSEPNSTSPSSSQDASPLP